MARYGGPRPPGFRAKHYSYVLREFLLQIGTTLDNPTHARTNVEFFMLSRDAQRMPRSLRKALIRARLLDPAWATYALAQHKGPYVSAGVVDNAEPPSATSPPSKIY